jgi:hypothetical protein
VSCQLFRFIAGVNTLPWNDTKGLSSIPDIHLPARHRIIGRKRAPTVFFLNNWAGANAVARNQAFGKSNVLGEPGSSESVPEYFTEIVWD